MPLVPVPQYLSSEWSFAQYRLPPAPPAAAVPSGGSGGGGGGGHGRVVVGFSPSEPRALVVVTQAGEYRKIGFDAARGGPCAELAACSFAPAGAAEDGGGSGGELGGAPVLV